MKKSDKVFLKFDYDPKFIAYLKSLPCGAHWVPKKKAWKVPNNILPLLEKEEYSARSGHEESEGKYIKAVERKDFFDFQNKGVEWVLSRHGSILNFEMGLGKTATALTAMELVFMSYGPKFSGLIVCPASVIPVWRIEIEKWTPMLSEIPSLRVCSYEALEKVQKENKQYHFIIVDESHYLKNGRSKRSKLLREITEKQEDLQHRVLLTGTLISDKPVDLHNQLDYVSDGGFGSWWKFTRYYCELIPTGYENHVKVGAILEDKVDELKNRMSYHVMTITDKDVEHLLHPLVIKTLKVPQKDIENKAKFVANWVKKSEEPTLVFTFKKQLVADIVESLEESKIATLKITGELTIKKRRKHIDMEPQVLVATMHSAGIGIDLTHYRRVLFAELYWSPAQIAQALARVHRLSSTGPAGITLLTILGTQDELVAHTIQKKLIDNKSATGSQTQSEQGVDDALNEDENLIDFHSRLSDELSISIIEE
jgi:SWI/SNF-related matrix-associated actin-dependent regulator 1 of chromatin subfamily A